MPFFKEFALTTLNIALISSNVNAKHFTCENGRKETLSSGSYTSMKIQDGCYVIVDEGTSLSGSISIEDGSKLKITDADLSNLSIKAEDGSYVSIVSSSLKSSDMSVTCQQGSIVKLNGKNLCSYRGRRNVWNGEYQCQDGNVDTVSSGTYTGLSIEDECDVTITEGVTLSGRLQVQDESTLTITDATFNDVVVYAEDESTVSITTSSSTSNATVTAYCQDQSTVTLNGENMCDNRRRRSVWNGEYQCQNGNVDTVSSGTYTGLSIEDKCDVTITEGATLSGRLQIQDGSTLEIDDATLNGVVVYAEDESTVTITSSSISNETSVTAYCQDESTVTFNGENMCDNQRRRSIWNGEYQCQDGDVDTVSSGTYTGLSIEDECDVTITEGATLSGRLQVQDGSILEINDATLDGVVVYAEDESTVTITSSSDDATVTAYCQDESTVMLNGESIC